MCRPKPLLPALSFALRAPGKPLRVGLLGSGCFNLGHPIVGDPLYGRDLDFSYYDRQRFDNHDDAEDGKRWIGLHSHTLAFDHPGTGVHTTVTSPISGRFLDHLEALRSGLHV